jgi:hypothetical protein
MSNSFAKAVNIGVCVSFVSTLKTSMWTDAFINYAKVLITKHPLLAGDLFMYMAIIKGAISDATFDRVYMCDQQFRLVFKKLIAQSSRMNGTAFHTIMTVNTITPKTTFFKVIIITWSQKYKFIFAKFSKGSSCKYKTSLAR